VIPIWFNHFLEHYVFRHLEFVYCPISKKILSKIQEKLSKYYFMYLEPSCFGLHRGW